MLEKMRKTLSVEILVAVKVLVDNVCAYEMQDLVKPRFWKHAWIFLRCEVNYLKNKCGDPRQKFLVKLKEILWTEFIATQRLWFLAIT